jgi:hypothetical protein
VPSLDDPRVALDLLLGGPTDLDKLLGLDTALLKSVAVRSLTVADGIATVDLTRDIETRDSRPQVAQVIYTLTQYPNIDKVKFLVLGEDNGATGVPPQGRETVAGMLPDVFVESPAPDDHASTAVKVRGSISAAFQGFDYRVENPPGQQLAAGTVAVKLGSGTRRGFDQRIELPTGPLGPAVLIVRPPAGSATSEFAVPLVRI